MCIASLTSWFSSFLSAAPGAIAQGILWGIMAIGVFITFKVLDVADLTVDGSFGTGGAVFVACLTGGMPLPLALFLAFAAGCVAGLATGIFHTKFGIPAILAGILTQFALYSINLRILGGRSNLALNWRNFNLITTLSNIPKSLLTEALAALILIGVLYWLFGTEIGHALRATGCNPAMSRANGVNTNAAKVTGLILSNGIVAFAGAMLAQYQGFADVNMGRGSIVIGLAAVIIGEVIFGKIFRNFALRLLSAVLGGILYYLVIQMILLAGLNANDLKLLTALVVAVFLGVPFWKRQLSKTSVVKPQEARHA